MFKYLKKPFYTFDSTFLINIYVLQYNGLLIKCVQIALDFFKVSEAWFPRQNNKSIMERFGTNSLPKF